MAMNILVTARTKHLLSNRVTASFPRTTLLHGLGYRFMDALCNTRV